MILEHESGVEEGELLLVDKPAGWTSFDVVNKLRRLLHVKKIGHAGTLDPMATGLLIVCTGKKTRSMEQFIGLEKEYQATMMLGGRTESYDAETPVVERFPVDDVTEEAVRTVLAEFTGPQRQTPPMWSAVKVGGMRLYKYARRGEHVVRKPREVFVRLLQATRIALPQVELTVVCSKGTYVRGLVNDIGIRLGCGAYLTALRRTRIGGYHVADAMSVEDFVRLADTNSLRPV
jgi:tRNA pseudouridine55 synthase